MVASKLLDARDRGVLTPLTADAIGLAVAA
jgi:hypothetical protein